MSNDLDSHIIKIPRVTIDEEKYGPVDVVPLSIKRTDLDDANAFACGKCGLTYATKDDAKRCHDYHAPKKCGCGNIIKYDYRTCCDQCSTLNQLRKATVVLAKNYGDNNWVYSDLYPGFFSEGWFESTSKFIDHVREVLESSEYSEYTDMPIYVWASKAIPWRGIDIDNIIEDEMEDLYEDAEDHIIDENELRKFIKAWNAKQKIISCEVDYTRVVVFDEERFNELIGGKNVD